MCDQTEVEYTAGEIVWCKLSNVWWPAQVQNESSLDEEVTQGLKKKPLAIVKFFDEDMYDFVRDINQICSYNSAKKFEFIKKGMDLYRKGGDKNQMNKFPVDIVKAEQLTGGNSDILDDPRLAPEEKINVKEIFSTPKQEKNNKKSKHSAVKSKTTGHSNALARLNGLAAKKGYFQKDLLQESKNQNNNEYKCSSCSFVSSRLSTLYDHSRYNIHCSKVVSTKLTKSNASSVKIEKSPVKRKSVANSDTQVVKKKAKVPAKSPSEPKKIIKVKTMSVKEIKEKDKKNAEEEIGKLLLQDWEDEDELGEDTDTPVDSSPEKTDGKSNLEDADKKIDCFDFEENEEDVERNIRFGQKLPRVIPKDDKAKDNKTKDKVNDDDTLEMEFKNIMNETAVPIVTDSFLLDSSVLPGCSGKAEKNLGLEAKVEILTGGSENAVSEGSSMKSDDDNTLLLRALGCDSPAEPVEPQTDHVSKKRVNTTVNEVIKKFKSDKELLESLRSDSDDNSCSVDNNNLILARKTVALSDQIDKKETTDSSKTPKTSSDHISESLDKTKHVVEKTSENKDEVSKARKSRSSRRSSSAVDLGTEKKKTAKYEERNETKTGNSEKNPVRSIDSKPVKKGTPSKELSAADTRASRRLSIKASQKTPPTKIKEFKDTGANKSNDSSRQISFDKQQADVKKEKGLSSRETVKPKENVKLIKSSDSNRPKSKSPAKKESQATSKMDLPDDEKVLDRLLAQVFADSSSEKRHKSSNKGIKHGVPEKNFKKGVDNSQSAHKKPSTLLLEKKNSAKQANLEKDSSKPCASRQSPVKSNKPGKDSVDDKNKPRPLDRKSREDVRTSIEENKKFRMGDKSLSKGSKSPTKSPVHSNLKSKTELKVSKEFVSSQNKSKEPQSKNISKDSEKSPFKNESVKSPTDTPKPLAKSPERKVETKAIKKDIPNPLALLFANRRDEKSPKSSKSKRAPIIDKSIIDLFTPDVVKTVIPTKSSSGNSSDSGSSLKRRDSLKSPTKENSKKELKSKDSVSSPVKSPRYEVSSPKLSTEQKPKDIKLSPSLISTPKKEENKEKCDESSLINALSSSEKQIIGTVLCNDSSIANSEVNKEVGTCNTETSLVDAQSPVKPSSVNVIPQDTQASNVLIEEASVERSTNLTDHSSAQLESETKNNENIEFKTDQAEESASVKNESAAQNFEKSDLRLQETTSETTSNAKSSEDSQNLEQSESAGLVAPDNFLDVTKVPPQRDKVEVITTSDESDKLKLSGLKSEETKKDCLEGFTVALHKDTTEQSNNETKDRSKFREKSRPTETVTSIQDNKNSEIEKYLKNQIKHDLNADVSQEAFKKLTDNIDQEMEEMFFDGELPCKSTNKGSIPSPSESLNEQESLSTAKSQENKFPFAPDQSEGIFFDSKDESMDKIVQEIRNDSSDVTDQVKYEQDDNLNNSTGIEVAHESLLPHHESPKSLKSESQKDINELQDTSFCQEEPSPVVNQSRPSDVPSRIAEDLPKASELFDLTENLSNKNQITDVTNLENEVKDICQKENPIPLEHQFYPVHVPTSIAEGSTFSSLKEDTINSNKITDITPSIDEVIETTDIAPTIDNVRKDISEKLPETKEVLSSTTEISTDITSPSTADLSPSSLAVETCRNEMSSSKLKVSTDCSPTSVDLLSKDLKPMSEAEVTNPPSVVSLGSTEVTIDDREERDNIEGTMTEVVIDSQDLSPEKNSVSSSIHGFSNDYFESNLTEEIIESKQTTSPVKSLQKPDDSIISLITPEKSKVSSKNKSEFDVSNEAFADSVDVVETCEDLESCNEQLVNFENVSDKPSVSPKIKENEVKDFMAELISKPNETITLPTITDSCSLTSSNTSDTEKSVDKDLETEFPDYNDKFDVASEVVISDDKVEDESSLYNFDDQVGGAVTTPQYPVKKTKPFGDVKINFSSKPNNLMVTQEFSQKVVSADFLTPDKIKAIFNKKEDATVSPSIKPFVVPPQSQLIDSSSKVVVSTSSQHVNPFSADFQNMDFDINSMPIVIADDNELLVSSLNSSTPVCNQAVTSAPMPKLVMTSTLVSGLVSTSILTSSPSLSVQSIASSTPCTVSTPAPTLVSSYKSLPTGTQARRLTISPYRGGNKKYDLYIKLVPSNKYKLAPNSNSNIIRIPGKKKQISENRIIKIIPQKGSIIRPDTKELYIMTSGGKKKVVFKADRGSSILNKAVSFNAPDPTKSIVIKPEPAKSIVVSIPEASTSGRHKISAVKNVSSRTVQIVNHKLNVIKTNPLPPVKLVAKPRPKPEKSKNIQIPIIKSTSRNQLIEADTRQIKVPNILGSKSSLLKPSILRNEVKLSSGQVTKGFVKIRSSQVSEASQLIASTKASFDTMKQGRPRKVSPKEDILAKAIADTLEGSDDVEEGPVLSQSVNVPVAKQPTQPVKVQPSQPVSTSYSVHQLPVSFPNSELYFPSMPVITENIVPPTQPVFQIDCSQLLTPQHYQDLSTHLTADVNLAEIELPADPPPPLDVPTDVSSIPLPPEPSQIPTPPSSLPEIIFPTQSDQKFALFQNIGKS